MSDNQLPLKVAGLPSFGGGLQVVVIGATGGIGSAFVRRLCQIEAVAQVIALSRTGASFSGFDGAGKVMPGQLDLTDEATIQAAALQAKAAAGQVHLVLVASGLLHDGVGVQPEKTFRHLDGDALQYCFAVNATGPALVAKHFLPLLVKDRKAAFCAISARVGSIADNRLGGWYAYRASKAALNMTIKGLSIELARQHPKALCVALHPGTVDTSLSKPFQAGVMPGKLFSSEQSAGYLLRVLDDLGPSDSGSLFAWDGKIIPF